MVYQVKFKFWGHQFLVQQQYLPEIVSANSSLSGKLFYKANHKSEEHLLGTDHSPRGPHQWKTFPHQSSDGVSPPYIEQQQGQLRQHISGLHQRQKSGINPLHISRTIKASVRSLGLKKQGIMAHMVYTNSVSEGVCIYHMCHDVFFFQSEGTGRRFNGSTDM